MIPAKAAYVASLALVVMLCAGAAKTEDLSTTVLAIHNAARAEVGVPPLVWSDSLAKAAEGWANHLETLDHLEHSVASVRPDQGENLGAGPKAGAFTATRLANLWIAEKSKFRNGVFPDVSTTKNWADVGHYTQVVWRGAKAVGCAYRDGPKQVVLVCRYSPSGNESGERVF